MGSNQNHFSRKREYEVNVLQKKETQDYILMAFSGRHFWIRRVCATNGKNYRIGQQVGMGILRFLNGQWIWNDHMPIQEEMLCNGTPFGERGTLYIQKAERTILRTAKIYMEDGIQITVGSDHGNTVYYSFHLLVKKKHVTCTIDHGVCRIRNLGTEGCYLNGEAVLHTQMAYALQELEIVSSRIKKLAVLQRNIAQLYAAADRSSTEKTVF